MCKLFVFIFVSFFATSGVGKMVSVDPKIRKSILDTLTVDGSEIATITISNGDKIYIKFFSDDAPNTVKNFILLANISFFDSLTFHRVVKNFVVQGGDPLGNGMGGPGYTIEAEFNDQRHLLGTVAMARSQDPNSAGSQFYICLAPQPGLNKQYTVFGQVIKGMEVINQIKQGDIMQSVKIERLSYDKLCLLSKGTEESQIYAPPTPISITLPDYPKELVEKRIEGIVHLRILVEKNGEVTASRIIKSEIGILNEETLGKIVKNWVFIPAKISGIGVVDWINVVIEFKIKNRYEAEVRALGEIKTLKLR
ncbi:MAG: TonB family protein [Candidatus Stahlbacteria bacterium]|nr:TonB family protein [Candidatus Stahlbacteria bacterium]